MEEMEGVLFQCHFVMSPVSGAYVPSALDELWRAEAKLDSGKNVFL